MSYTDSVHTTYQFMQSLLHSIANSQPNEGIAPLLQQAQQCLEAEQVVLWAVDVVRQELVPIQSVPADLHPLDAEGNELLKQGLLEAVQRDVTREFQAGAHWVTVFALQSRGPQAVYAASIVRRAPLNPGQSDRIQIWRDALNIAVKHLGLQQMLQQASRQHEKQMRQFTALYEIGQMMQSREVQPLLDLITRKAAEVMEAQACSLMLRSDEDQSLVIRSSWGIPDDIIERTRVPWGRGIAGRVAASGEVMLITDPRTDPRLSGEDVPYREDIEASLCVPLRDNEGQVIGVLNIHRRKPAAVFSEHEVQLFTVFAMQAASVIKNAQLYRDLQNRLHELSVLSELSAAVNSSLQLDQILEQTADSITETVHFDRCAIFLIDSARKLAIPQVVRGYRVETLGRSPIRISEGIIGSVVRSGKQILVTDSAQASQPARGFGRMLGAPSYLVAPIVARDQVIGVVVADNKPSGRPIDSANIQLLTTFINHAGMAIENARLYQNLDQRFNELHNLWEYTRNLLSSIGVGVMSIDREEIVLTWNTAAYQITSLPQQMVLGRRLEEVVDYLPLPANEKSGLLEIIRAPFQSGRRHSCFKYALHPWQQGERYFNVESSPLRAPDGSVQGVVVVFEEVTREVQMEAQVRRMEQLATIGQLASTIAHELRNPLSSIRASAQHLRREYQDFSDLCEFLDIIINEVDTLNARATEFLRFARPVEPVFQEVNLLEIIQNTVHFMQSYIQEQGVQVRIEGEVPYPVQADPAQLKEALRNLLINSVQAMPDGGTITISVTPLSEEMVQIVVKDTGQGIPSEQIPRVFEPFFTTKTKGTGLGLAIVHKIIESHGGTITVSSEVGVGTEMRIVLPRVVPQRPVDMPERTSENLRMNAPDG